MAYASNKVVLEKILADGQTKTASINVLERELLGIYIPAGFSGTAITFEASEDDSVFKVMKDWDGNTISLTVAADTYVGLDTQLFLGVAYCKLVSGTAQSGEVTFKLITREL